MNLKKKDNREYFINLTIILNVKLSHNKNVKKKIGLNKYRFKSRKSNDKLKGN